MSRSRLSLILLLLGSTALAPVAVQAQTISGTFQGLGFIGGGGTIPIAT